MTPGPKVLVTSLPKSGTNLMISVLTRFPDLRLQRLVLNRNLRWHPMNVIPSSQRCLIGVDQPKSVKLRTVSHILTKLQPNCFTTGHVPYAPRVEAVLRSLSIRTMLVLRDPRDVVVSQMYSVMKEESHYLHSHYSSLQSDRERLLAAILGVKKGPRYLGKGIRERLELMWPWTDVPEVATFVFEDLVGESGGGKKETQADAISKLARHIGVSLNREEVSRLGREAFGTGLNFRRGQIGEWRKHFDQEMREIFQREAGDFLIRMNYEQDADW